MHTGTLIFSDHSPWEQNSTTVRFIVQLQQRNKSLSNRKLKLLRREMLQCSMLCPNSGSKVSKLYSVLHPLDSSIFQSGSCSRWYDLLSTFNPLLSKELKEPQQAKSLFPQSYRMTELLMWHECLHSFAFLLFSFA